MNPENPASFWENRYSVPEYVFGVEPNAFLVGQAGRLAPGSRVLCVADGEGRNSVWLARQGHRVTAFDFSPAACAKARTLARCHGVEVDFRLEDLLTRNWEEGSYDAVVAIFIQFLSPAQRLIAFPRMQAALHPGGLFLLQGYRPEQLRYRTGGPSQEENLYTEPLLRDLCAPLEILHLAAYDAEILEGSGHRGMSALIDLVARRPLS